LRNGVGNSTKCKFSEESGLSALGRWSAFFDAGGEKSIEKVKEKRVQKKGTKEKVKAAPKTLVRRGLEDGTQRLRGQLRDAAQGGRADEYGGDRIEDAAAGGTQWAVRGIDSLLKKKKASRYSNAKGCSPSPDTPEPDTPAAGPGPEAEPPISCGDIGADSPAPRHMDRPRIKTREAVEAPAVRSEEQRTAPLQRGVSTSGNPEHRMDRPQIKTRETASHVSPEAGSSATAQVQRIKDTPVIPKGRVDSPPIKTREFFTARTEGGGTSIPAGRHGAGRPIDRRDISDCLTDRQGTSGHPGDWRNASSRSDPVKSVIKTKESYIAQSAIPTDTPQPTAQGGQEFVRERGRTAAIRQAEIRRVDRRTGSGTMDGGDVPPSSPRSGYINSGQRNQSVSRVVSQAEYTPSEAVRGSGGDIRRKAGKARKDAKTLGRKARNTVKTAERPVGQAVGTAEQTARSTQAAAQTAARAVRRTVQNAQVTTKAAKAAAGISTKSAVKAASAAAKGAVASLKALAAAATAGGPVVVAVVLVICIAGLLIASPFGVFFADGSGPDAASPSAAIVQINGEFADKLTELQSGGTYDRVEVQGGPPAWADVFAVFAAKTAGAEGGSPVAVLDTDTMERLRTVFWDMTKITTVEATVDHPASGNTPAWTETVLTITVTPRTPGDMRVFYSFTDQQNAMLDELLTPESRDLWSDLLYGAGDGIVAVALSQVGNVGGQPYWSWYGFNSRVEWCACFVSWCANECGYIDAGVIPRFSGCISGSQWFKDRGLWRENDYEPHPGDVVFFDWDNKGSSGPQDGLPDHVGIVERMENGTVYTVEGNSGNQCRQRSYSVGHYEIFGYGTPLL